MKRKFVVMYRFFSYSTNDYKFRNVTVQAEDYKSLYKELEERFIKKDDIEMITDITSASAEMGPWAIL